MAPLAKHISSRSVDPAGASFWRVAAALRFAFVGAGDTARLYSFPLVSGPPRYKTWDDVRREGLQPQRRLNSWDLLRQAAAEQARLGALR